MPIVLFRVDERLIHGQVVVGWGERLHADRIVVVDDEIAGSPWEQELYCLGVPPEMEASFATVAEARRSLPVWKSEPHRRIILVRSVEVLAAVAEGGLLGDTEVILGGLHHSAGRERVLPYLFLSTQERQTLERLAAEGVVMAARDLPGARRVPLEELRGDA
jgi:PTS system mannose-specific IIB component/fructoselysine and glucoselysine-specific PTS system IIB component